MPDSRDRVFLFLQGPIAPFFRRLGRSLMREGFRVLKVHFNGGDVYSWPRRCGRTVWFQGGRISWPAWLAELIERERVTDVLLTGEWRPLHVEAVDIAKGLGLRVFIFEEGYLRPDYITMEEGGINGCSLLPKDPGQIKALAWLMDEPSAPTRLQPHTKALRINNIAYYAAALFLWPFFARYKTHRPYGAWREALMGWGPRLLIRRRFEKRDQATLDEALQSGRPFFLLPLQLDSDAQVRRYSPFSGMLEGLSMIMNSFARHSDPEAGLLVRNHPLDPGLINYRAYVLNYARALGIEGRVRFIDSVGSYHDIIAHSRGLVLLNSTIGLTALLMGKPVYYLGKSICSVPGLGCAPGWMSLQDFWTAPAPPDPELAAAFVKILRQTVLVNGNFYTAEGARAALPTIIERLIGPPAKPVEERLSPEPADPRRLPDGAGPLLGTEVLPDGF